MLYRELAVHVKGLCVDFIDKYPEDPHSISQVFYLVKVASGLLIGDVYLYPDFCKPALFI